MQNDDSDDDMDFGFDDAPTGNVYIALHPDT